MFCETGVIGTVSKHGIALVEEVDDNEISYFEDTYCEVPMLPDNFDKIKRKCLQK